MSAIDIRAALALYRGGRGMYPTTRHRSWCQMETVKSAPDLKLEFYMISCMSSHPCGNGAVGAAPSGFSRTTRPAARIALIRLLARAANVRITMLSTNVKA